MVVNEGRQKVVCRRHGVQVAGKVQVDVFHRNDLCITAAGRAALDTEYRSERGLTKGNNRVLADFVQSHGQTDGAGGFSFACRCRRDGGNQNQFAILLVRKTLDGIMRDFRFIFAVQLQIVFLEAGSFSDFDDGLHFNRISDFNIGFYFGHGLLLN